jgi:hypothetical protein
MEGSAQVRSRAIAKNLLDFGTMLDFIVSVTGLSSDEVEALRDGNPKTN